MALRNRGPRRRFIKTGLIFVPAVLAAVSARARSIVIPGPMARFGAASSASAEPELSDWVTRVQGRGSDVTGSGVQAAVGDFIIACKTAGIWTKLKRVNVYAGDGLAALEAPLLNTWGSTTDTLTAFDSGDYSEATGLTGDGSAEYINTGLNLTSVGASIDDIHASVYVRTAANPAFSYGLGVRAAAGANLFGIRPRNSDASLWFCTGTGGTTSAADVVGTGLYTGSRISDSVSGLYRNTTSLFSTDPASTTLPNATLFIHALSDNGTPSSLNDRAMSFYSVGTGLTSSEVTSLYNAVQALQTALGRQV